MFTTNFEFCLFVLSTDSISSLLLPGLQSAVLLRLHSGVATATFEEKLPESKHQDVSKCLQKHIRDFSSEVSWLRSTTGAIEKLLLLFLNTSVPATNGVLMLALHLLELQMQRRNRAKEVVF